MMQTVRLQEHCKVYVIWYTLTQAGVLQGVLSVVKKSLIDLINDSAFATGRLCVYIDRKHPYCSCYMVEITGVEILLHKQVKLRLIYLEYNTISTRTTNSIHLGLDILILPLNHNVPETLRLFLN
jgi:hypothetical protein